MIPLFPEFKLHGTTLINPTAKKNIRKRYFTVIVKVMLI